MEVDIELYETASGHCPFDEWFENIRETHTRAKILVRVERLKLGNFGDCKSLGNGVTELRIHYGPGIRIYYTKIGRTVILLFCGGCKDSQVKDINKANEYLKEYKSRVRKHEKRK